MNEPFVKTIVAALLGRDMWTRDFGELTPVRRSAVRLVKWALMLGEGVARDRVMLRASALTFTTVLSIVPFLAVAFSVLKGFGFQNKEFIRNLLHQALAGREQVADAIISYINNTNVRTLGGVGVGLLLFTVVNLLSNIEISFNTIWGVERGRSIGRKTADYFSVSLIVPVLIVTAISFTATLQSTAVVRSILSISVFSEVYLVLLKLVPYISVWLALTFIYSFVPNTRVRWWAALSGGVLAGTLWQLAQWFYVAFQIGAAKYNAIYGSFAQLPLFLIWVYMSWVIVLLGAEMCFAFQNFSNYEARAKYERVSLRERLRLGLALLLHLADVAHGSRPLPTDRDLAARFALPVILVRDILGLFCDAGLTGRVCNDDSERFALVRAPSEVRVKAVLDCLLDHDGSGMDLTGGRALAAVDAALGNMDRHMDESGGNLSLDDLRRG
ncbi:MAG: YihY/virulence factor BrkB family protein [Desulfovibrionaceae bacterium]|nr:YihY/virulence factor BrkB family protein [Desulfovibrionaceae bacterium]